MKLWKIGNEENSGNDNPLARAIEAYTVGDDPVLDQRLVPWDCMASVAHATMLQKIGVLTADDLVKLKEGLQNVLEIHKEGKFEISKQDEDCHTAIENYLVENLGDVGKRIHTARSRNDQVLTALKLYYKNALFSLSQQLLGLAETLIGVAERNPWAIPGYTHMQKGMPSTVGLWAASFVETILDDLSNLKSLQELVDSSPLGAAAGYGVTFPIDRELTAQLMGFDRVQSNVISVQNSRGKNEALILGACAAVMVTLSKIGSDLLFFSQGELGYLKIPLDFCTGSSIMPQKRNPDVLELLRGKATIVAALANQSLNAVMNMPSGYHRDFQLTKKPLFDGLDITTDAITIIDELMKQVSFSKERCEAAMSSEVFAADIANQLVEQGMPFRDAYRKVKEELDTIKIDDPYKFINTKTHTGGPGNLALQLFQQQISKEKGALEKRIESFTKAASKLLTM